MATYCSSDDLVLGDAQVPAGLTKSKFIGDAADEIDSQIGFRYVTPVAVGSAPRPVGLLLKRLNSHLATGLIILAANQSGEQEQLHAYGSYLVKEVRTVLRKIASGEIILEGAVPVDAPQGRGPVIANVDAVSQVESFYGALTDPTYTTQFPTPYRAAGG